MLVIVIEPAALRIAVQSEFYGESRLNRLMMTVMLAKAMEIESLNLPAGNADFVDQDEIPEVYAGYVHALRMLGEVEGFEGRFEPLRSVNRGEAAVMMTRVLNMFGGKTPEISIEEGRLVVELTENPTTGYTWSFSSDKEELLEPVENKSMESSQNRELVGAGGTHRRVFRGLVEGEARLTFRYYRVWEGENASIDERVYSVRIAKGGEISAAVL